MRVTSAYLGLINAKTEEMGEGANKKSMEESLVSLKGGVRLINGGRGGNRCFLSQGKVLKRKITILDRHMKVGAWF